MERIETGIFIAGLVLALLGLLIWAIRQRRKLPLAKDLEKEREKIREEIRKSSDQELADRFNRLAKKEEGKR